MKKQILASLTAAAILVAAIAAIAFEYSDARHVGSTGGTTSGSNLQLALNNNQLATDTKNTECGTSDAPFPPPPFGTVNSKIKQVLTATNATLTDLIACQNVNHP